MEKILTADFSNGASQIRLRGIWQHDYGAKLKVKGIDYSTLIRVDFAGANDPKAYPVVAVQETDGTFTAKIPKEVTDQAYDINAYIYVSGNESGYTVKQVVMPVQERVEADPASGGGTATDPYAAVIEKMTEYKKSAENSAKAAAAEVEKVIGKSEQIEQNKADVASLKEDLDNQKVVPMTSINPCKMNLDKYDVVITEGKYLTGRNTTSHTPTMTQNSNYEYDIIDIAINPNNTTITVPYDTAQSAGQVFVLYTEGLYSNNAAPDNVNKNQIGVIGVGDNSYTVNLHASAVKYERVAFTVPKGRRDFYFNTPDEGEIGKILEEKISDANKKIVSDNVVIAPVNMFYSIGAIGDSYTAGSALSSDGGTWQDVTDLSWIATMGKRAGIYWSNYGKGGATTKSYITDKLPSVLSGQAKDLYFIALGINDSLQNLTVGTVADIKDDYTQNGESYYGWYGSIISQVQAHAPKAKIVLVKIWTNGTSKIPYDNAIDEIAEHFELPVINPFDDDFFNSSLYLDNMVSGHPTPMTYPCIGLAMERLFSRCVIENPDYFKFATIG